MRIISKNRKRKMEIKKIRNNTNKIYFKRNRNTTQETKKSKTKTKMRIVYWTKMN